MKWFGDIKIRSKLFLVFGILVSVMICFAFFATAQIKKLGDNNNELLNAYQARQLNIAEAGVDLYKMRCANIARAYTLDDESYTHFFNKFFADYNKNMRSFAANIDSLLEITINDPMLTVPERHQRLVVVDSISDLFMKYSKKVDQLKAAVENKDREGVYKAFEEGIPLGNDLSDRLDDLRDLISFTTKKKVYEAAENTTSALNAIFAATVGFIALSAFGLLFTVNNLNRPISELEKAAAEISAGNLAYPIRTRRKDEIGVLSNRISDMVDTISEHNKTITIMDNFDSYVCVSDFDHNLLYVNKLTADAYGLDADNYAGKKCYGEIMKRDGPCTFCKMRDLSLRAHAQAPGDAPPSENFEYLWDDVLGAWMGGVESVICWTDGSPVYFRHSRDVTQKKRQEEMLQDALRAAESASAAKSSFLANMSHEMRTPMNAVIGFSELLIADKEADSRCAECSGELKKIYNAGMTLLNIINDILDISKIESGKFDIIPVEYDLSSFINDTVMLNYSRIGERPIKFVLDIDENLPSRLYGDDLRVKQICNNLLSNAFKYTKGGTVTLSIRTRRGDGADAAGMDAGGADDAVWMVISVRDTGIGIREQDLKKLFTDYSQVDTRSNRSIEGTGLGLALTKRLSEIMGGNIAVESEYGKGSVFTVTIKQSHVTDTPIGPAVAENLRNFKYTDSKRSSGANLTRIKLPYARILLVDDLRVNLEVAKGMMKPYGMQIDCATSGAEAVDAIRREDVRYSAVFMDHMMPGMDGVEAARIIREEIGTDYAKNVPIIVLTANAIAGNEEMFLSKGFQAFLSKPIDIMRLDNVIRKWVRDKSLEEADAAPGAADGGAVYAAGGGAGGAPADDDANGASEGRNDEGEGAGASAGAGAGAVTAADTDSGFDAQTRDLAGIKIEGLDLDGALKKFGDMDTVARVLRTFAEDTPALLEQIRNVTPETLRDYTIIVHGLKGSCMGISARELGEQAKKLEDAARAGRIDYVAAQNGAFIHEAGTLAGKLRELFASETPKEAREAPDPKLLSDLLEACRAFDVDGLDKAMSGLTSYSYEKDGDLVRWLEDAAKVMGFKQIAQRLSGIADSAPPA